MKPFFTTQTAYTETIFGFNLTCQLNDMTKDNCYNCNLSSEVKSYPKIHILPGRRDGYFGI